MGSAPRAISIAVSAFVALIAIAVPASAQDRVVPYVRAAPQYGGGADDGIGVRVFGTFGYQFMTASQTFQAVVGSSMIQEFGAGAEVTGLAGGLFARVGVQLSRAEGHRVFVVNGTVVSTGIPLTVEMLPIDVAVGWRTGTKDSRASLFIGAGASFLTYKETSEGATADENVNERVIGYLALAGLDFRIAGPVFLGAEGQYRLVPNALGAGGVSKDYNETDLGGIAARVRVGFRF